MVFFELLYPGSFRLIYLTLVLIKNRCFFSYRKHVARLIRYLLRPWSGCEVLKLKRLVGTVQVVKAKKRIGYALRFSQCERSTVTIGFLNCGFEIIALPR